MGNDTFNLKIKEIAEISDKYPLWKVHWIGEISSNGKTREPLIDLWLVPYKYPKTYNRQLKTVIQNEEYDFTEMRTVSIGVGQLTAVGIGSFFNNGEPLARTNYISHTFKFTPTVVNQKIISFGSYYAENNEKRFFIPTNQFRVIQSQETNYERTAQNAFIIPQQVRDRKNQENSDSLFRGKCVLVEFKANEKLKIMDDQYPFSERVWKIESSSTKSKSENRYSGIIIPCIELIRFYYANSSQMFREVFTDGLIGIDNRVFTGSKTRLPDENRENGFLWLADEITNLDAPYIARFVFDPDGYALKQARNIYYSLINSERVKGGRVPEAYFPFKDQPTNLKVHGIPIQSGLKKYFFVYWLESCTGVFPFKSFSYWRNFPGGMRKFSGASDSDVDITSPDNQGDSSREDENLERSRYQSNTLELRSDIPASEARIALTMLLCVDKFPDLASKEWKQEDPESQKEKVERKPKPKVKFDGVAEPTEHGSTAPRDGNRKVTKSTLAKTENAEANTKEEETAKLDRLNLFISIHDKLKTLSSEGISAKFIYLSPSSSEFHYGNESTFLSQAKLKVVDSRNRTTEDELSNMEFRIMEIIYNWEIEQEIKSFHAYLFDIIPSRRNKYDNHCLCLVYKENNPDSFNGAKINQIIIRCASNGGTWFKFARNVVESNIDGSKKTKVITDRKMERVVNTERMIKIRHNSNKAEFYVKHIIDKIKNSARKLRSIYKNDD
jgi:hypothetical protein